MLLNPIKHLGTTTPSGTDIQALVMEIVVTFSMMFIASAVATDSKAVNTQLFKTFPIKFPVSLTSICLAILNFPQIGELAGIAVGSAVCITSILAG